MQSVIVQPTDTQPAASLVADLQIISQKLPVYTRAYARNGFFSLLPSAPEQRAVGGLAFGFYAEGRLSAARVEGYNGLAVLVQL